MPRVFFLCLLVAVVAACSDSGEKSRCATDNECPSGHRCIGGECSSVDPCEGIACQPWQECVLGKCEDKACDPPCTTPPGDPVCYDLPGTCSEGRCIYRPISGRPCDDGDECTGEDACRANGACTGEAVVCPNPPADICLDANTLRRFLSPGACSGGECSFPYEDYDCPQGCRDDACLGCQPEWVDATTCGCTPGPCAGCSGNKTQEDGCGSRRTVSCELSATGCQNICCADVCCQAGEMCFEGTCCRPDCQGKQCGDDGCGGSCSPGCQPDQICENGSCVGCGSSGYGWDFNLTRRCARTVCEDSSPYYFEDTAQCVSASSWLVAVESEASLGASCPGPANCSFLINGPDSPVRLEWHEHAGECGPNWTVHMLVDHSAYPSPCAGDYWTWFAFMDHDQTGGGPYPPALNTTTHHLLNYSDYTSQANSSARVFIGGQWWWGGKARAIEFNLALSQWGDADPHPGLIVRFDTPAFEFLALDATYWNLQISKNVDTGVDIPWGQILQDTVASGWLESPSSWNEVSSMAYFVGIEVKNRAIASLWHSDFRIQSQP